MKDINRIQLNNLLQEIEKGSQPLKSEYDNNIPFFLNEHLRKMSYRFDELCEKDVFEDHKKFFNEVRNIENLRGHHFSYAFEYLTDKYFEANKTNNLLNINNTPFILYLHGYTTETNYFNNGSFQNSNGGFNILDIIELAEGVMTIPIVYVSNPSIADPFQRIFLKEATKSIDKNIYRVLCSKNWLEIVEMLVLKSNLVFFEFNEISDGVEKEIALLRKIGKINKTIFKTSETNLRQFDLNHHTKIFNNDYKVVIDYFNLKYNEEVEEIPITTFWLTGNLRSKRIEEIKKIFQYLQDSAKNNVTIPAVEQSNIYSYLITLAIMIEDINILLQAICWKIYIILQYPRKYLKNRNKLIFSYLSYKLALLDILKSDYNLEKNDVKKNIKLFNRRYYKRFWIEKIILYLSHRIEFVWIIMVNFVLKINFKKTNRNRQQKNFP